MIYSSPIDLDSIYPINKHKDNMVIIGDDFQGFCYGFNTVNGEFVEISPRGDLSLIETGFVEFFHKWLIHNED